MGSGTKIGEKHMPQTFYKQKISSILKHECNKHLLNCDNWECFDGANEARHIKCH